MPHTGTTEAAMQSKSTFDSDTPSHVYSKVASGHSTLSVSSTPSVQLRLERRVVSEGGEAGMVVGMVSVVLNGEEDARRRIPVSPAAARVRRTTLDAVGEADKWGFSPQTVTTTPVEVEVSRPAGKAKAVPSVSGGVNDVVGRFSADTTAELILMLGVDSVAGCSPSTRDVSVRVAIASTVEEAAAMKSESVLREGGRGAGRRVR
jgi:hypothetical protein